MILCVVDSVQVIQRISYQGSSRRVLRLKNRRTSTSNVKYAGDVVLLAKEATVLQGKLIE